jgi:hypothetical protein
MACRGGFVCGVSAARLRTTCDALLRSGRDEGLARRAAQVCGVAEEELHRLAPLLTVCTVCSRAALLSPGLRHGLTCSLS